MDRMSRLYPLSKTHKDHMLSTIETYIVLKEKKKNLLAKRDTKSIGSKCLAKIDFKFFI